MKYWLLFFLGLAASFAGFSGSPGPINDVAWCKLLPIADYKSAFCKKANQDLISMMTGYGVFQLLDDSTGFLKFCYISCGRNSEEEIKKRVELIKNPPPPPGYQIISPDTQ